MDDYTIENNLIDLWLAKETEIRRHISIQEVANATGLRYETIRDWKNGLCTARFDAKVLHRFCTFFNVEEGPIPFLIYIKKG